MKVSFFASILCLFSATVLAAPPSPPAGKTCKTLATIKGKQTTIESVSGECYNLPEAASLTVAQIKEPASGRIEGFNYPNCQGAPYFSQQSPVSLYRPFPIVSLRIKCE